MTGKTNRDPWFYVSLIASTVAIIGLILALLPQFLMSGAEAEKLSTIAGIFFAEFVMVLAALGLLGCLRNKQKTATNRAIAKLNGMLLIAGFLTGLWLFLG